MIKNFFNSLLLVALGCSQSNYDEQLEDNLHSYMESKKIAIKDRKVVVIFSDLDGCNSCTDEVIKIKNSFNKGSIYYVFAFQYNPHGYAIQPDENVILDKESKPIRIGLLKDHPLIYYLENGTIREIDTLSVSNRNLIRENILQYGF